MDNQEKNQMKEGVIQQINIAYVPEEDRLLLRIAIDDSNELAIWLTRRSTKILWDLLNDNAVLTEIAPELTLPSALKNTSNAFYTGDTQALLQEFAKSEAVQKLNFSEPYQQRTVINQEVLLLVTHCQIVKFSNELAFLELQCQHNHNIKLALNANLLLAITNLLQLAIQQAEWNVGAIILPAILPTATAPALLH